MLAVITKSFGGLPIAYYCRQFLFGLLFPIFLFYVISSSKHAVPISILMLVALNTLLYPYARFVYEGVIRFVLGENVLYGSAILMLSFKLAMMEFCWAFAILLGPIGLVYLYFYHSRAGR